MKKTLLSLSTIMLTGMLSYSALAQSDTHEAGHDISFAIPEVALLDLETDESLNFTFGPDIPEEAGMPVDFTNGSNSDVWLNYTSLVSSGIKIIEGIDIPTLKSRKVKVSASANLTLLPVNIVVSAAAAAAGGGGTLGTPTGDVTLSLLPQDLITAIGSCYTGDGVGKGHQLTYTYKEKGTPTFGTYSQGTQTVTVTYTLTDDIIL